MKMFFKILNAIITFLSTVFCIPAIVFRLSLFFNGMEFLVPFATVFCYLSLCFSALSVALNFITYSLTKKNILIPFSILNAIFSLIMFIIALCS